MTATGSSGRAVSFTITGGAPPPATYIHHITESSVPVQSCAGPRPGCATTGYLNTGDSVSIVCQAVGGYYHYGNGGTTTPDFHVWDQISGGGWVPDGWVDTANVNASVPPSRNVEDAH